jgi:hypothetical protein
MKKYIPVYLVLALLLIASCDPRAGEPEQPVSFFARGYSVYEFKLKDGTSCAMSTGNGSALTCGWRTP